MIKNIFHMTRERLILDVLLLLCIIAMLVFMASVIWMPGSSYRGTAVPQDDSEKGIESNLRSHIKTLASDIGQRNSPETLQASIKYIENTLKSYGYTVAEQDFLVDKYQFKNIEAQLDGTSAAGELVLVGAHYDSVTGSPGADDNGSGVATVLELARLSAGKKNKRTVRFVLFASEEPPFFSSQEMGSFQYAARCKKRGENIHGLLVMETIGYYTDAEKSQTYPVGIAPGYPDKGNFIAFVGNQSSRPLLETCISNFRSNCKFPSEGVCAPDWINGIDWSDQYWFWKNSYPAIMITDTALYRYPHYHMLQDTPDKLNYPSFARVVSGLSSVLDAVAN